MGFKLWKWPVTTPEQIDELTRKSGLPWILCATLAARGICGADEAKAFFEDKVELEDPFRLIGMDKAVARISEAIEDGERIAIYGDYDCDGITATALLTSYLQSVGADVIYYVPDREKEGYGLNKSAIEMLKGQKVDLIVTVDNGISAHDEIAYANALGIDVVVTDHHTPRETLPDTVAVVNPHRSDCPSRFKYFAGVGVAFKLVCALENAHPAELLEYYSDFVALGTIADVVPLLGENRVIVKHGLARLQETERPGLKALLDIAGLSEKNLSCEAVAFGIIPRINAAGRMGVADDVIELLLTDDTDYAEEIAERVNGQNSQRKKTEEQIILEIDDIIRKNPQILLKRVLIISGNGWHHGVVGIVAAKIVEKYGKPCILLSIDGDTARGSGRSIEGFSLIEAIAACSKHLLQYGGHTLAAGLTIETTALEAFDDDIQSFARKNYARMPSASCRIDCVLPANLLNVENIAELSVLEPFGAGNAAPLFILEKLTVEGIYPTGDQKHIRIRFSKEGTQFYAVYFGMPKQNIPYGAGCVLDVVAGISAGEYNGKPQLSVKIRDLRPSGVPQEQICDGIEYYSRHMLREYSGASDFSRLLADREDLAVVYKFLRKSGGYTYCETPLYYELMASGIDYCRMLIALDVLEELRLITRSGRDAQISLVPDPPKVNIENSMILSDLKAEMQVIQRG